MYFSVMYCIFIRFVMFFCPEFAHSFPSIFVGRARAFSIPHLQAVAFFVGADRGKGWAFKYQSLIWRCNGADNSHMLIENSFLLMAL